MERINQEWSELLRDEAWKTNRYLRCIPAVIEFTCKVELDDNKCLMAQVRKTPQLNFATKDDLHFTIAYHNNAEFLANTIEIIRRWLQSLTISQRRASLYRWGERLDVVAGHLVAAVAFGSSIGLALPGPQQIEFHKIKGVGHWRPRPCIDLHAEK